MITATAAHDFYTQGYLMVDGLAFLSAKLYSAFGSLLNESSKCLSQRRQDKEAYLQNILAMPLMAILTSGKQIAPIRLRMI